MGYGIRKNLELKTILLSQKMKALQMELTKNSEEKIEIDGKNIKMAFGLAICLV